MQTVNILAVANGVGISRDVAIIKRILEEGGYSVDANHTYRFKPTKRYDLGISLERFNPHVLPVHAKNVMIPNQEWFEKSWLGGLGFFDAFFTKTNYATSIFDALGCKTHKIGFTSDDRYMPSVVKDHTHWIHIAGKSIQKQTEIVIRTWANNPGFPQLTIIQDPKFWKPRTTLKNVNFMLDRVPEDVLKIMQNVNLVHVCPSETEGFGHYIMEAMSAKGIVITTDAPPMNELVTAERGMFVKSVRQEPMNLSTKYIISEKSLEEAVIQTMVMDEGKKADIANKSREFYLHNDAEFKKNLLLAVKNVLSQETK